MGIITPTLPTSGVDRGTEEIDVLNTLTALVNLVNGDLDTNNLDAAAGITAAQLAAAVQQALPAPGDLKATAVAVAPSGWLMCDGSAVSRSGATAALFAAIGTAYGVGDGSTTFNLPDLRGRVPVGKGAHADVNVLGESDGLADAARSPKHTHTLAHTHTNNHTHTFADETDATASFTALAAAGGVAVVSAGHTHSVSGTTGGVSVTITSAPSVPDTGVETLPYQVVNYMIRV